MCRAQAPLQQATVAQDSVCSSKEDTPVPFLKNLEKKKNMQRFELSSEL